MSYAATAAPNGAQVAFLLPVRGELDRARGMSDPKAPRRLHRAAWKLAGWQALLTAAVATAAGLLGTGESALSALAGGAIGVVAGLYQALRVFSVDAAAEPKRLMRAVYVSEIVKIIITAALFVAAIKLMRPRFLPMMAAYAATFLVYWAALGTGWPQPGYRQQMPEGPTRNN